MKCSKAQSGLEYLVTYGWAIFIILIVSALLWYMGVFDSVSFARPSLPGGGFGSFAYFDHQVKTNSATIILFNTLTRAVTVNSATVGTRDEIADTNCNSGLPKVVGANGNITITCNALPQGGIAKSKEPYDYSVKITFVDSVSGNTHTDIGFIRGKVE